MAAASASEQSKLPQKTREFQCHIIDSTVWNDFKFRPDDVIISTWAKSGTTWTQRIALQLIHSGDPTAEVRSLSPWLDMRVIPHKEIMAGLEAQTCRRVVKTHLPRDAMVWDPKAKYIFVGWDGRDVAWSMHNHTLNMTDAFYSIINDTPGRVGPPLLRPTGGPYDVFVDLIEDDTRPSLLWPFWSHTRSWWEARDQPNILLVNFCDLKADFEGEMRRIAAFLGTPDMSEDQWKAAVEHCSFDWMREHADQVLHGVDAIFEGGGKTFVNKGVNGRWKDVLSEEDNRRYMEKARAELGEDCALWLEKGRLGQ